MICTAKPLRADISVVRTKKSKKNRGSPTNPPQLGIAPKYSIRRRFISTGVVNGNFTLASGHNQFLVAVTASLGDVWVDCWRIKKLEAWSPLQNIGGNAAIILTTVGISADNMYNDRGTIIEDSTTSTDRAAHIVWKPPRNQPSGSWHVTSTTNSGGILFTFSSQSSTIVDITFDYVPNNYQGPNGYQLIVAGATTGALFSHSPISNLVPVGVNVW